MQPDLFSIVSAATCDVEISAPLLDSATPTSVNGDQSALFDVGEAWEKHWNGMPEFVQRDLSPFKTIYVHFETREDMQAFAELVGQRIGLNTRFIWYPEAEVGYFFNKRYIDAPPPAINADIDVEET
mgnify:CR=1 FL=1